MGFPILMQILLSALAVSSPQEPEIVIRPPLTSVTRVAVIDFQAKGAPGAESDSTLKVFNDVLWKDLDFSGFFEMRSKSFYPSKPVRGPQDVVFEEWRSDRVNADFLVFGNLQLAGGGAVVEAYLYDAKMKQQVLGKRFTAASITLIRNVAHNFADEVVYQLSAGTSKGVARTQIAFSSQKGGSKEIQIVDYDGANARTITANGGLNKFPEWSRTTPDSHSSPGCPAARAGKSGYRNSKAGGRCYRLHHLMLLRRRYPLTEDGLPSPRAAKTVSTPTFT